MLIRHFFFLFFITFISASGNSQVIVVDDFYVSVDEIEESIEDEILLSVRKGIKKYENFAGLLGENDKVTVAAIEGFNDLFVTNALIYSDITNEPSVITCENYSSLIFAYLDRQGVEFDMFSAVIDGIDYNEELGIYSIDVLSRKYLFNGINEKHKPFYCNKGRAFNLRFTFEINDKNLEIAKISKIQGNLIKECSNKPFAVNPYFEIGWGRAPSPSANFSSLMVDYKSVWTFSAGIKFQQLFNQKGNTFFTFGAGYSRMYLRSSWNGFFNQIDLDDEGVVFDRITQISNGTEVIKLQFVEVPVGVKLRIGNWSSFHLFIEPFAEVKFGINRPGNTTHFQGEYISYGVYSNGEIAIFNFEEDNLLPSKINRINTVNFEGPMFSLGSNFSLQYILNSKIGFELSGTYKVGLNRLDIKYPVISDNLKLMDLSEKNLENFRLSSIGIQLGVITWF